MLEISSRLWRVLLFLNTFYADIMVKLLIVLFFNPANCSIEIRKSFEILLQINEIKMDFLNDT